MSLIYSLYSINIDWFNCGWSKKSQMADSKKLSFFKNANSQYFFDKISGIGPWVYKINWCKGHWCENRTLGGVGGQKSSDIINRCFLIKPTFISRTNECGSHKDATDVGFKNNWDHTDQLFLLNMLKMAKNSREERKKPTRKYLETIL